MRIEMVIRYQGLVDTAQNLYHVLILQNLHQLSNLIIAVSSVSLCYHVFNRTDKLIAEELHACPGVASDKDLLRENDHRLEKLLEVHPLAAFFCELFENQVSLNLSDTHLSVSC